MKWEEPPGALQRGGRRGSAWEDEADTLRAHEGEWAIIAEYGLTEMHKGRALVHQIITGRLVAFRPTGEFEAVSRKQDDVVKVYARYVGPSSSTTSAS